MRTIQNQIQRIDFHLRTFPHMTATTHRKMLGSFECRRSKEKKSLSAYGLLLISILRFYPYSRCR